MEAQRALLVTSSFPRYEGDFAGSFVFRFALYLVRSGLDVCVLAPGSHNHPETEVMGGIRVYRFPYFLPRSFQRLAYGNGIPANLRLSVLARLQVVPFFLVMIWKIIRLQHSYDIVHCHWLPTAAAALLARTFASHKPPIVLTNWGSDTRLLPIWLTRWVVNHVDGCISTAAETDEHLLAAGRTDFRHIPAPVEEERFSRDLVKPDLRHELKLTDDERVVAFVGRLNYFKDPLTFIRACAILAGQGQRFRGIIAGDGELMEECQRTISELGIGEYVTLLGMRDDPERLLRISEVAVHISPVENTWANVIAEAMFMEVPVVLTRVGHTERLFTHERNCLLVSAKNPGCLAHAILRLLNSSQLREQLAGGATDLLKEKKKDSRSIVRETRAYYDELLAQKTTK